MPKMKSNRGAAKRFRKTKSGEYKRDHGFTNHLRSSKSSKRRRNLRHSGMVSASDKKRVKDLLAC